MDRLDHIRKGLRGKGWVAPEIDTAERILKTASSKRTKWIRVLDSMIYWLVLLVAIVMNFVLSIVLVPFLLVFTGPMLILALVVIAVAFGTMLDVVVRETEHLQQKHYVMAEVFIPAIALINIYIITRLSGQLATLMELPGAANNPLLVSVCYVAAFIAPHIILGAFHRSKHSH